MSRTGLVFRPSGECAKLGAADGEEPDMTKFLLTVDYNGGVFDTPMTEWAPEDIKAHMDYYRALDKEITDSGELVEGYALTGPELAKVVISGGGTAPVVPDGPFVEFKEMLAGYQLVDVESEERAIEIEMAGDMEAAVKHYRTAASRTNSTPEQHYLTTRAARLKAKLDPDLEASTPGASGD
jgi:hypothetical protein